MNIIKYKRERLGLTSKELAQMMGYNAPTWRYKENGATKLTLEDGFKLNRILGLSFEELKSMYE